MLAFFIVMHVIICLALIFIVLIQTSKGGLDSNFGGMATNVLGTQGANEFVKTWTKILFGAFVISCVLLAYQVKNMGNEGGGGRNRGSRLVEEAQRDLQNMPASENIIEFETTPQQMERRVIEIGD
jgi:preprotein translocase subunit SecG